MIENSPLESVKSQINVEFDNSNQAKIIYDSIILEFQTAPDYRSSMDLTLKDNFIIIDTKLTDDLIKEGIARELVSKIQNLRKEKDFNVADRITLYYNGDIKDVIDMFNDYIKKETLSLDIIEKDDLTNEYDLNGKMVKLDVEKVTK